MDVASASAVGASFAEQRARQLAELRVGRDVHEAEVGLHQAAAARHRRIGDAR